MKTIMEIEWKEEYEVGNFEIDSQHKTFVGIIFKLQQAVLKGKSTDYTDRLLLELFKYTEFHFCSEENLMLDVCYPDVRRHQDEHKKLLF